MNDLYHYGIKGMKWGVRRFQNPDGSYTSAGRARYNLGSSSKGRQEPKNKNGRSKGSGTNLRAAKSASEETSKMSRQAANMLRKSASKSRARKQTHTDLSRMSDQELRDRVNRGNLERQYNQLYRDSNTKLGRDHVANFLDVLGDTVQFAGSAASLALIIYGLKSGKIN